MRYFFGLWVATAAVVSAAQNPPPPAPSAIQLQHASVQRQLQGTAAARDGFFTTPWLSSSTPAEPLAIVASAASGGCDRISPVEIDNYVEEIARREGFTPDLLRAVIHQESSYLPCAVSSKGAQGMMQLMPETSVELGVADPFDPWENIDGGARYLGALLDRYNGDPSRALAAYNAGPTRVDQYDGIPPIPETMNYVREILDRIAPISH